MPAPPLLLPATNSQPVETGSDWEIPSRFSFHPMAPRKVWTGVTPMTHCDWLALWWRLPTCCPIAPRGCQSFQFAQAPTRLLRPERKRGQTPWKNGLYVTAYRHRRSGGPLFMCAHEARVKHLLKINVALRGFSRARESKRNPPKRKSISTPRVVLLPAVMCPGGSPSLAASLPHCVMR